MGVLTIFAESRSLGAMETPQISLLAQTMGCTRGTHYQSWPSNGKPATTPSVGVLVIRSCTAVAVRSRGRAHCVRGGGGSVRMPGHLQKVAKKCSTRTSTWGKK